jgi:hypothetical protein
MILSETKQNYFILNIFIVYLASTSTTTPPYCAPTCTGNQTNYDHTYVDTGGYFCHSSSTYCTFNSFYYNGTCDSGNGDSPCPSDYCCVYDTYSSSVS